MPRFSTWRTFPDRLLLGVGGRLGWTHEAQAEQVARGGLQTPPRPLFPNVWLPLRIVKTTHRVQRIIIIVFVNTELV